MRGNRVWGWFGLAGMLAVGFLYLGTGLVAPLWAVLLLGLVWLALFVLGLRLLDTHPVWIVGLPFLATLIWILSLNLGDALLGWTA